MLAVRENHGPSVALRARARNATVAPMWASASSETRSAFLK